jgi:hypothetical protein
MFKGFKGKFIYWAFSSLVGGFIIGVICFTIWGYLIGTVVIVLIMFGGIWITATLQKKGIYNKDIKRGIFIFHNVFNEKS